MKWADTNGDIPTDKDNSMTSREFCEMRGIEEYISKKLSYFVLHVIDDDDRLKINTKQWIEPILHVGNLITMTISALLAINTSEEAKCFEELHECICVDNNGRELHHKCDSTPFDIAGTDYMDFAATLQHFYDILPENN
jgi:hypothetical protein